MILTIKCPECNSDITIHIENDKVISVGVNGTIKLSDEEIKRVLSELNIELGLKN